MYDNSDKLFLDSPIYYHYDYHLYGQVVMSMVYRSILDPNHIFRIYFLLILLQLIFSLIYWNYIVYFLLKFQIMEYLFLELGLSFVKRNTVFRIHLVFLLIFLWQHQMLLYPIFSTYHINLLILLIIFLIPIFLSFFLF